MDVCIILSRSDVVQAQVESIITIVLDVGWRAHSEDTLALTLALLSVLLCRVDVSRTLLDMPDILSEAAWA